MRKARYDMRQVVCPNASCIGHSSNIAKPGYWITWNMHGSLRTGRVLGRIAECDDDGYDCAGFLVVMMLHVGHMHAGIQWIEPTTVTECYDKPPKELFAWITGDDWVKNKGDIARLIAMSEHGTTSESYIATRNDPDKPYNSRPGYNEQYILL